MKVKTPDKGKYDDLAIALAEGYHADGAMVMVFGGDLGFGCSIKIKDGAKVDVAGNLRSVADQLERDIVMKRTLDLQKPNDQ